jgi:UDP-N-acetylglucosamine acyltransferase
MPQIHPSAIVSPHAELGENVSIGALCVLEDGVILGDNCKLANHVVIKSGTTLGADNEISEGAVLGGKPQHLQAGDKLGQLRIGNGNVVREHVTIHRALKPGDSTRLGDSNLLMVNSHIAHDCHLGDRAVIVNNVMVAGHVSIGDGAYFGGAAGVHQFCRVGRLAMIGGQAHVSQDVPPFVLVDGISNGVVGLNLVGLRRSGFSHDQIKQLKVAYRILYRSGNTWKEALAELAATFHDGPAAEFYPFLSRGERGFVQERKTPRAATIPLPTSAEERRGARKAA